MKLLAVLPAIMLAGCMSVSPGGGNLIRVPGQALSYQQVSEMQVSSQDCDNIQELVDEMDHQIALKGLTGINPENMSESDRRFNSKVHIVKWSLIIGCNNPNRYAR